MLSVFVMPTVAALAYTSLTLLSDSLAFSGLPGQPFDGLVCELREQLMLGVVNHSAEANFPCLALGVITVCILINKMHLCLFN